MPLQLTDKITHDYPVGDMLNIIEEITERLKWIFIFGTAVKPSVNVLMTNLPINYKLQTTIFFMIDFYP